MPTITDCPNCCGIPVDTCPEHGIDSWPGPAPTASVQEFVRKYGTRTVTLTMLRAAGLLDGRGSISSFLREMASDLESMLGSSVPR